MGLRFRRNDDQGISADSAESVEDRFAAITPGVPGRCPECDGFGYIDHADLVSHTQVQHCRDCSHRWEYRFDAAGNLLEIGDIRNPGTPPKRIRYIDLTEDGLAPAQRPTVATTAGGHPADPTDAHTDDATDDATDEIVDVTDATYRKSPAQWLRDVAKHT